MQQIEMILNIGLFVVGLAFLVLGSDYLIQAATGLAKRMGVSDLLIGLTIVAIGTSIPEIVASIASISAGKADLALSNIAGSSLTNMTLIVGISAIVAPLATNHIILERDTKIMIFSFAVLGIALLDPLTPGVIAIWEAAIMLLIMLTYLTFLHWGRAECDTCYQFHIFVDFFVRLKFLTSLQGKLEPPKIVKTEIDVDDVQETFEDSKSTFRDLTIVTISVIAVAIGAQWVVSGAEYLSLTFGIGESVIGFTLIALGTSLPELTVSINSARHGFGRLLIGNVVGSNIMNITLGLGIGAFFFLSSYNFIVSILMVGFLMVISAIFFYFVQHDWKVTRKEGGVLILLYVIIQLISIYVAQLFLV
ncbi:MAG: calcium/sodium antiporter [Candidatus Lokiarchaeota archaeon]|nr:calcium/sodium antiporter [Candidatus Lokiarchaeota archaeon]